jgi:hypothetical protein
MSVHWEDPTSLGLSGVWLVAIREGDAIVELSPRLAATVGCSAGLYRLGADDTLSSGTRILAVLSEAMLVEKHRMLFYLTVPGARALRWMAAWRMRGTLPPEWVSGGGGYDGPVY